MSNIYRFLQDELSNSQGFIERSTLLATEACRAYECDSVSDFMENFLTGNTPQQLCKIFGLKEDKTVYDIIEACYVDCSDREGHVEALQFIWRRAGRDGFLAEVRTPERSNFKFKEDGDYSSCSVHTAIQTITWVYAETYAELVKIACDESQKRVDEMIKKAKEKEQL